MAGLDEVEVEVMVVAMVVDIIWVMVNLIIAQALLNVKCVKNMDTLR